MKKIVFFIGLLIVLGSLVNKRCFTGCIAYAQDARSGINYNLEETIEELELENLEEYYYEFNIDDNFSNKSIKEVLYGLITGEEELSLVNVLNVLTIGIKNSISDIIKLIITIVIIVAVSALSSLNLDKSKTTKVVNYIIIIFLLSLVSAIITSSISKVVDVIYSIKNVMEVISPILLALLVSVGGVGSSTAYGPIIVLLTGSVVHIVAGILVSIITIYFVLSVLTSLNSTIKLDKLKTFFLSSFKWILSFIFTIFIGYLSLSGITAGGKDGLSIKTAKFALKSYLPLVGGYVSDSYEIFRAGSILIKNALGTLGVIILFGIVVLVVIKLVLYNLCFKFACGITEPFASRETTSFLSSLSVVFNYLIACVVSVFMMSFIIIIVIISTANSL